MKLLEALRITNQESNGSHAFRVGLACGFTPLHLETFLIAQLRTLNPTKDVELCTGFYGDLVSALEHVAGAKPDAIAAVLEWADLDPRLGIRSLGGWGPDDCRAMLDELPDQADRVSDSLHRAAALAPLVLCLPSLPLPPCSSGLVGQGDELEAQLRSLLALITRRANSENDVMVISPQYFDSRSMVSQRLGVRSLLLTGFPYRLDHASDIAEAVARLIYPAPSRKGLVTDLDGTVWKGIVGEDGVDGLGWTLDKNAQIHGLYQQVLNALGESGVLLGVATKNDLPNVERAFARRDLVLKTEQLFPVEAHWRSKSESISNILKVWNLNADSVVFVDDSAMELAEVKAVHPEIECVAFPAQDWQAAYDTLSRLRGLFGKQRILDEDVIRRESLRQRTAFDERVTSHQTMDAFLAQIEANIDVTFTLTSPPRVLELVNKTNQFNLNGRRFTESEWRNDLSREDAFLMIVEYRDKYGPLGRISVVGGQRKGDRLVIDTWVLSCRAFARRIEHQCLRLLFSHFEVDRIQFEYQPTPKNGALRSFLQEFCCSPANAPQFAGDAANDVAGKTAETVWLSKETFAKQCPTLSHRIGNLPDDESRNNETGNNETGNNETGNNETGNNETGNDESRSATAAVL